jgi:hypothetical protein
VAACRAAEHGQPLRPADAIDDAEFAAQRITRIERAQLAEPQVVAHAHHAAEFEGVGVLQAGRQGGVALRAGDRCIATQTRRRRRAGGWIPARARARRDR